MQVVRTRQWSVAVGDQILIASAISVAIFSVGWLAANGVTDTPVVMVIIFGGIIVVAFCRGSIIIASRIRFRRTFRLERTSRDKGPKFAAVQMLANESQRLLQWQRIAERLHLTALRVRLRRELGDLKRLQRDVAALSTSDLDFALNAELPHQDRIVPTRYVRDTIFELIHSAVRGMERLTGLPLTANTAKLAAADRLAQRLTTFNDRLAGLTVSMETALARVEERP
jgi:hypothetical protein